MSGRRVLGLLAELVPLAGVLATLGTVTWLLLEIRRPTGPRPAPETKIAPRPIPALIPKPEPAPEPSMAAASVPPPKVPDPKIALFEALLVAEGNKTDQQKARAEALTHALVRTRTEARRWRNRAALVRGEVDRMVAQATRDEAEARTLQLENEQLALQRDLTRRSVARARERAEDSYAVVPYRAPDGTWRQPLVLDCRAGAVHILPDGPDFSRLDLRSGLGRSSPFVAIVRRRLDDLERKPTPDGLPGVPYVLFLVRPDGIRPYYEARTLLEPLGIAFGYELIDQGWDVEAPQGDSESSPAAPESLIASAPERWPVGMSRHDERDADTTSEAGEHGSGLYVWPKPQATRGASVADALGSLDDTRVGAAAAPSSGTADVPASLSGPRRLTDREHEGSTSATRAQPSSLPYGVGADAGDGGRDRVGAIAGRGGVARRNATDEISLVPPLATVPDPRRPARNPEWPGSSESSIGPHDASPLERAGSLAGEEGDSRNAGAPGPAGDVGAAGAGFDATDIEWVEITAICRADGVLIQPGGYRITRAALTETDLLSSRLRDVGERLAGERSASGRPRAPRLRFVVEPGGESTFWDARRATVFEELDWPTVLQVAEGGGLARKRAAAPGGPGS